MAYKEDCLRECAKMKRCINHEQFKPNYDTDTILPTQTHVIMTIANVKFQPDAEKIL